MPSAANAKSEKPASSEATDNSPIRQIITIIEHKVRNLEKRKSKLTSYRDLQKAGKELKTDQKIAVAKYDEVAQTLEFARDLSKQITAIAASAEREAKKQAKKDAWVRYAAETNKIREALLILDCLMQMGNSEAREDFLNGANGATKLTEEDLKILDDLYSEVTPKHVVNEEGQPGFHMQTVKAAEHLYAIIDGKQKEILGTTYAHIKEIVNAVHECGYFDKTIETVAETEETHIIVEEEQQIAALEVEEANAVPSYPPPTVLPVPPAPAVVPAPGYPLRPLPPITLQEVEHAYFSQQYPQQRPISEVIGSQNFFFLQESEIDSPVVVVEQEPVQVEEQKAPTPVEDKNEDEWQESQSPKQEDSNDRRTQGQGDGQNRFRRYGRGGRGASNGYRGRGNFQNRQNDGYHPRGEYQNRINKDGYQNRQYDGYQNRHKDGYQNRGGNDGYYGNGDTGDSHQQNENGGRDRYNDSNQSYQGGFKSRGRGGPRGDRLNHSWKANFTGNNALWQHQRDYGYEVTQVKSL
ncbi:unnamed protein product [Parnassius apollo]|uniref:(apollo) hypothetical protein n=1 Tax=Parnassius apollo TaxID=110799 RepID=A0A8S3Y7E4_PARAO|nr:unnamed protein product [Parnassius apollo]